jgi:hypothetical protein
MPRLDENWYLVVDRGGLAGLGVVGTVHKSLTQELMHSRYIACQVLTSLRVQGVDVSGTTVAIMRDGEIQAKDEF